MERRGLGGLAEGVQVAGKCPETRQCSGNRAPWAVGLARCSERLCLAQNGTLSSSTRPQYSATSTQPGATGRSSFSLGPRRKGMLCSIYSALISQQQIIREV